MRPDEWDRMPGPWRLVHALSAGVVVGLVGAALALRFWP